jgi:hypothetical protein
MKETTTMKRTHLLWIAPWIAFGLGACATVQRTETSKACAEWRWIAVRSTQAESCPEIPGWDPPRPLFAPPAAATRVNEYPDRYGKRERVTTTAEASEALRQLERFCVYETDKKLGKVPLPPLENGKLVRVDQDCAAISVAGTEWVPFSTNFLDQAGKPVDPLEIKNRRGVRLAFLDTHPTGVGAPAERPTGKLTSEHGYTLAHMARNLICSPAESDECAALITTRLALPIQKFDSRSRKKTKIDTAQGGSIGTQADLANAIWDEVNAWQKDLGTAGAPQKLVLNLSVGWDGELFGGLDEEEAAELRAGAQAVYWALRYAASFEDVLVLAAAGNACKSCEREPVGPLLPAAWEERAPMAASCEPGKQLVYAVGGVNAVGRPLENARENGMPRRAAYGTSGVVPALAPGQSTHMYTGTSVATAVASSVAAIVWDTLPDSSPGHVIDILERSGDDLTALHPNVRTNFFFGASTFAAGTPPPVRRISLCPALREACAELGNQPGCPLKPETTCTDWEPATFFASIPPRLRRCDSWVHTQPPDAPCPICEPPRQ